MSDEKYVICGGEYSDWWIVAYADTLEEAIAYCANSKESLYVMPVERISTSAPKKTLWCTIQCVFENKQRSVNILGIEPVEFSAQSCVFSDTRPDSVKFEEDCVLLFSVPYHPFTEEDVKKWKKIALDYIYKLRAEQNNL